MSKIVLISGKAQAGKDTAGQFIQHEFHRATIGVAETYSFAGPLKDFCHCVFNIPREWLYGTNADKARPTHLRWVDVPLPPFLVVQLFRELRKTGKDPCPDDMMTVREVLQIFGSNICRAWYGPCWAQATFNKIREISPDVAIITDVRFPNELEVFQASNPIVIRLTRNTTHGTHASETVLDDYDFASKFPQFYLIDNRDMTEEEKNEAIYTKMRGILWS